MTKKMIWLAALGLATAACKDDSGLTGDDGPEPDAAPMPDAPPGVTIVDVPAAAPAAAVNFGITGPITSGTTMLWRLAWDPVTTYANGAPLEPGRTVRYTAYWTDDPALSAGSLRPLASPVSATTVDFDPVARLMPVNQPAYLTVRSELDTGAASSLAAGIEWVVANAGPAPPAAGIIIKK